MSHEIKGSTPGSIAPERHHLTRVNTFPAAEFTIPPSDFAETVSRCPSHRTRGEGALEQETSKASERGEESECTDEESQSVVSQDGDHSYPEGGLAAWLVVAGSFSATVVAFGMMNTVGICTFSLGFLLLWFLLVCFSWFVNWMFLSTCMPGAEALPREVFAAYRCN